MPRYVLRISVHKLAKSVGFHRDLGSGLLSKESMIQILLYYDYCRALESLFLEADPKYIGKKVWIAFCGICSVFSKQNLFWCLINHFKNFCAKATHFFVKWPLPSIVLHLFQIARVFLYIFHAHRATRLIHYDIWLKWIWFNTKLT